MSDQYLHGESGSSFHEGHGGQIFDNRGAEIAETALSEAENESTHFTDFGNMSGQIPYFGNESSFAGNDSGYLVHIPYSWIPSSQPAYHTNFSMDFNRSGLNPPTEGNSSFAGFSMDCSGSGLSPHLEGNSSFTENVGDLLNAAATLNCEEYGETRYSTNLSNPDQNYDFGDGWSFSGGAGEQFSDASVAGIPDNAAYDAKAPQYPNKMPQSAVGPQSGYNWQDTHQSSGNYNIEPSDSDPPNESPLLPRKHRRTQSGDNYNIGRSDQDQSNALPPHPRKHRRTRSGDDGIIGPPDPDQSNGSPSQPQKKPEKRIWTREEDGKILTRVKHGIHVERIAEELNRTVASCRYRKSRLKLLEKSQIEALIKAQEEADAIAELPTDVPILRMKNAGRIDWATPGMKDISCVDLETPGLNEWIGRRVKALRSMKEGGSWTWPYHIAAGNLNEVNKTNLSGKDLLYSESQYNRAHQQW